MKMAWNTVIQLFRRMRWQHCESSRVSDARSLGLRTAQQMVMGCPFTDGGHFRLRLIETQLESEAVHSASAAGSAFATGAMYTFVDFLMS